ncbi:helix-turn-helix domain-containing protein [Tenacibaculum amylolyticum]|uniref:helix-turn-helix domain-containing protein n=1 Tax=Tenacibaculum amylolyticum TaxID=104269 RepID=UPI003895335B
MRLKIIRKQNNETQKDLADLLNVSTRTVQYYENGKVTIPNDKLKKIATHYSVSVAEIFNEKEIVSDLDSIETELIAQYVVENWQTFMKDGYFNANFKSKASEWALLVKKES